MFVIVALIFLKHIQNYSTLITFIIIFITTKRLHKIMLISNSFQSFELIIINVKQVKSLL